MLKQLVAIHRFDEVVKNLLLYHSYTRIPNRYTTNYFLSFSKTALAELISFIVLAFSVKDILWTCFVISFSKIGENAKRNRKSDR